MKIWSTPLVRVCVAERYYSQLEPVDATVSSAISLTSAAAAQQADRQSPSSPHHHNNNNNK